MSLASLAAELQALSESHSAPETLSEDDMGLLARGAVDYVLSEAEGDTSPEDIGLAITIAAGAAAQDAGEDAEKLVEHARGYLRRILAGTEL